MREYDIVAIGGGSGGLASMEKAAAFGKKAAVIEGGLVGGTCVNVGCVPKKIMWYGAQIKEAIWKYGPSYGIRANQLAFDFDQLRKIRETYVEGARDASTDYIADHGIDLIRGYASFKDRHTLLVNGEEIWADHILIASGGRPVVPDIPGASLGEISDDFFAWEELPESVAVIGAGYIAVEIAGILHGLGVKTDLFVRRERPLRSFDEDIVRALVDEIKKDGPGLHTNKIPKAVSKGSDGRLEILFEDGSRHLAERLLWAVGRKANINGLHLENAGVEVTEKGTIKVDEYQNTSIPGIYAIGDVSGEMPLTPVAIKAGVILMNRLFGGQEDAKMDYNNVATLVFSHPPIGSIGMTEKAAKEYFGGEQVKTYNAEFSAMYTAVTSHGQTCRFKMITAGAEEKVVGLHALGYGVDEMMQGFAVAIKMGARRQDFQDTVAIHPTVAEDLLTL